MSIQVTYTCGLRQNRGRKGETDKRHRDICKSASENKLRDDDNDDDDDDEEEEEEEVGEE